MVKITLPPTTPIFKRPDLLLHPNIPKPMHGLNPRTIMGKEWWDKKRKEAYRINNNCCWACGIHKDVARYHQWLEAHESYNISYRLARMTLKEIVALCHSCHNYIHSGRLRQLWKKGEISKGIYDDIMGHGDELTKNLTTTKQVFVAHDWKNWHLIIDGVKFHSKFRNYKEWEQHYGKNSKA